MGERPAGKTLDRIDTDKGYEPGNCRWATATEQQNNKKNTKYVTYKGETDSVANWARKLGCGYFQLYDRLRPNRDLSVEEAFAPFI